MAGSSIYGVPTSRSDPEPDDSDNPPEQKPPRTQQEISRELFGVSAVIVAVFTALIAGASFLIHFNKTAIVALCIGGVIFGIDVLFWAGSREKKVK